jgi:hypothetical protein
VFALIGGWTVCPQEPTTKRTAQPRLPPRRHGPDTMGRGWRKRAGGLSIRITRVRSEFSRRLLAGVLCGGSIADLEDWEGCHGL